MEKLVSAVVGCGRMGAFTSDVVRTHCPSFWLPLSHVEALLAHPGTYLAAICDPDLTQLAKASVTHGIASTFQSYEALIETVRPSLLTIATRARERSSIIEHALSNGVRALHIEKPLCNSVQQLNHLESRLSERVTHCTYGALRRYLPPYVHAQELLTSGKLGELREVQVNLGKGQLFWTHPHSVDQILYYVGNRSVRTIYAEFGDLEFSSKEMRVENDPVLRFAVIQFEEDVTGFITQCEGSDTIISGSEGTVAVQCDGHSLVHRHGAEGDIYWRQTKEMKLPSAAPGGTYSAIDRLVQWMSGAEPAAARASLSDMILGTRVLFGMAQSAIMKRPVTLEEIDPRLIILGRTGGKYA